MGTISQGLVKVVYGNRVDGVSHFVWHRISRRTWRSLESYYGKQPNFYYAKVYEYKRLGKRRGHPTDTDWLYPLGQGRDSDDKNFLAPLLPTSRAQQRSRAITNNENKNNNKNETTYNKILHPSQSNGTETSGSRNGAHSCPLQLSIGPFRSVSLNS